MWSVCRSKCAPAFLLLHASVHYRILWTRDFVGLNSLHRRAPTQEGPCHRHRRTNFITQVEKGGGHVLCMCTKVVIRHRTRGTRTPTKIRFPFCAFALARAALCLALTFLACSSPLTDQCSIPSTTQHSFFTSHHTPRAAAHARTLDTRIAEHMHMTHNAPHTKHSVHRIVQSSDKSFCDELPHSPNYLRHDSVSSELVLFVS